MPKSNFQLSFVVSSQVYLTVRDGSFEIFTVIFSIQCGFLIHRGRKMFWKLHSCLSASNLSARFMGDKTVMAIACLIMHLWGMKNKVFKIKTEMIHVAGMKNIWRTKKIPWNLRKLEIEVNQGTKWKISEHESAHLLFLTSWIRSYLQDKIYYY